MVDNVQGFSRRFAWLIFVFLLRKLSVHLWWFRLALTVEFLFLPFVSLMKSRLSFWVWEITLGLWYTSTLCVNRKVLAVQSVEAGGPRAASSTLTFYSCKLGIPKSGNHFLLSPSTTTKSRPSLLQLSPRCLALLCSSPRSSSSLEVWTATLITLNCLGINQNDWEEHQRIEESHRLLRGNSL